MTVPRRWNSLTGQARVGHAIRAQDEERYPVIKGMAWYVSRDALAKTVGTIDVVGVSVVKLMKALLERRTMPEAGRTVSWSDKIAGDTIGLDKGSLLSHRNGSTQTLTVRCKGNEPEAQRPDRAGSIAPSERRNSLIPSYCKKLLRSK